MKIAWIRKLQERARRRRLVQLGPKQVFARYYVTNKWGDRESRSGKGSNLRNTEAIRAALPDLLRQHDVHSMLDLPCGDFYWLSRVDLGKIDYVGGDIVPEMVEQNRKAYGGARRRFDVIDLIEGPLPSADLVFSRDGLVHLSNDHVWAALQNIRRSGSRLLLATLHPGEISNTDIVTGQWRPLDLTLAPFFLPPPIETVFETYDGGSGQVEGKRMALWRVADIPDRK